MEHLEEGDQQEISPISRIGVGRVYMTSTRWYKTGRTGNR